MKFKNKKNITIEDLIKQEYNLVHRGSDYYGKYFTHALYANSLLNNFVGSINKPDYFFSLLYLSLVRKYHTLAMFSSARRHNGQTMHNLRTVLESTQWMAFAMDNKEEEKFYKLKAGKVVYQNELTEEVYPWFDKNFKNQGDEFRKLKGMISGAGLHADIVYAFSTFKMKKDMSGFNFSFFDENSDFKIKGDFLSLANIVIGFFNLILEVNKKFNVFQLRFGFENDLVILQKEHNQLRTEYEKHKSYTKSLETQKEIDNEKENK